MNRDRVGDLILAMKDRASQVEFVDRSELRKKLESPEGSYVQFVLSGDILHPDKLMHCVEFAHSDHSPQLIFSLIHETPARKNLPAEIFVLRESSVTAIYGKVILKEIVKNSCIISSSLSRSFILQDVFKETYPIQLWLDSLSQPNLEPSAIVLFSNLMLKHPVHFLNEELVTRGCRDWSESDLALYKNWCGEVLKQLKE